MLVSGHKSKTCLLLLKLLVDWQPLLEGDSLLAFPFVLGARGLVDHRVRRLQSRRANDITDLGSVDLAVQFLVVKVEDLLQF